MKILTNLSGECADGAVVESRGVLQVVQDEPAPGFFRQVTLGHAGVQVRRGATSVLVPLAELLALTEKHEPGLRVPEPAKTPNPEAKG